MHSNSRKNATGKGAPQSTTAAAAIAARSTAKSSSHDGGERASLPALSDDVLHSVLLYCGPRDVEERVKPVNRRLRNIVAHSTALWKEFCILTGKAVDARDGRSLSSHATSGGEEEEEEEEHGVPSNRGDISSGSVVVADTGADLNRYRQYYFRNPCVPIDFPSIQEASDHCSRTTSKSTASLGDDDDHLRFSSTGTVVVMPGVYRESLRIRGEPWAEGRRRRRVVEIRAAFPRLGATIASPRPPSGGGGTTAKDRPCVAISTCDDDDDALGGGAPRQISVRLSHLRILHSSPGSDIWGGNTAIDIEGRRASVVIDSCVLQSDSGRGLVVANQAIVEVYRTSIQDCAATGFYLGDWGSSARLSACNIVRNGVGSKRLRAPSPDDGEAGDVVDRIAAQTRAVALGHVIPREDFEVVPPGHSGVYIESSMCWIDDCLIGGNCLTGLSVVRGGFVSISASDVTENGSAPIMIEDTHDVRDRDHRGTSVPRLHIRGGVVCGPDKNNYSGRGTWRGAAAD